MKTASKKREMKTTRRNYMCGEAFGELRAAMEDALAFQRGSRRELVVTRMRKPRSPRAEPTEKISDAVRRRS